MIMLTVLGFIDLVDACSDFSLSVKAIGFLNRMDHSPSDSVILRVLKLEKEIFWAENSHLSADQIQDEWAIRNAKLEKGLNSVLGPAAPIKGHHLVFEALPSPGSQLAVPSPALLVANTRGSFVWQSVLIEMAFATNSGLGFFIR